MTRSTPTLLRFGVLIVAVATLAAACSDSDDGESAETTRPASDVATITTILPVVPVEPVTPPPTVADSERRCDGGAFPDDEVFRLLVCDVQYLRLDVLAAGVEEDPSWLSRASQAILTYDVDRTNSMIELEALRAELTNLLAN